MLEQAHKFRRARLAIASLQLSEAWRRLVTEMPFAPDDNGMCPLGAYTVSGHRLTACELRAILLLPPNGTPTDADRRFTPGLIHLRRRSLCTSVRQLPSDVSRWRLTEAGMLARRALVRHLLDSRSPVRRTAQAPYQGQEQNYPASRPGGPDAGPGTHPPARA